MEIIQFIIKIIISGFVVITTPMEGNDLITSIINGSVISEAAIIAVPMLVVALIIPLVIFVMGDKDLYGFDKSIVLNKVLYSGWLIALVFSISFLLFFSQCRFPAMLLNIILIVLTLVILNNSYHWITSSNEGNSNSNFRQKKRLKHLKGIKSQSMTLDVWNIILNDEKLLEKNQIGFIDVLIQTLKRIETEANANRNNICSSLLNLLNNNIEKINFTYVGVYENLTDYLLSIYSDQTNRLTKNTKRTLLFKMLEYGIKEDKIRVYDYLFFQEVEKYFKVPSNKEYVPDFYADLLNNLVRIGDVNVKDLWENNFLRNNTITKDKLESKEESNVTTRLLYKYVDFFKMQIEEDRQSKEKVYGSFLNRVTLELFPTIEPFLWFNILLFYRQRGFGNLSEDMIYNRIQGWYGKRKDLFFHGRIPSGFIGQSEEQDNKEESIRETIFILQQILEKELKDLEYLKRISSTIQEIIKKEQLDKNSEKRLYLEELDRYIGLLFSRVHRGEG